MLEFDMDLQHGILTVHPRGTLTSDDFSEITAAVDTYIETGQDLAGLMIHAEAFPGWDGLKAMLQHFRFIRNHHKHIRKVAVVSDAAALSELPAIADHFVQAKVMHFAFDDMEGAREWILEEDASEEAAN